MKLFPIKQLVLCSLLVLHSVANSQALATGKTPWQQKCQTFESEALCAEHISKQVYEQHSKVVSHTGEHLVVKLTSGRTKLISDAQERYAVTDYLAQSEYLVVRQQYSQGNTWLLLSLQSGLLTKIDAYPIFSPNQKYFFAWEPSSDLPDNLPIARIFRTSHPVPIPEWQSECEDILEWRLASASWASDVELTLQQGLLSPQLVQVVQYKKPKAGRRWLAKNLDCAAP